MKDEFFALVISVLGIGLGQLYVGNKSMGLIIMGIQIGILILAGVILPFSLLGARILFLVFLVILIYAAYDAFSTARYINQSM